MAIKASFDGLLSIRMPQKDLDKLKRHCKKMNRDYQDIVREMIVAINEGRLTITHTEENKKALGDLYVN